MAKKNPQQMVTKRVRQCIRDAGGIPAVAKHFGLRDWAVRKWFNFGHVPVSAEGNRVSPLVKLANKMNAERAALPAPPALMSREEPRIWTDADLRPDVFGAE